MLVPKEHDLTPRGRSSRVSRQAVEPQVPAHGVAATLGNQQTQRLLAPHGAFAVSEPGDASELEAERLADQLVGVARPSVPATVHERCDRGNACYQRETSDTVSGIGVASLVGSSGQPLDRASRAFFESQLGRDLSQVRIHTGPEASRAAVGLSAHAFTVGRDIVFGEGRYAPETSAGRRLLAHELVHTVKHPGNQAIQRQHAEDGEKRSVFRYHGMARSFELFINSTPPPYTLTMCAMTNDIVGHAWISIKAADGSARTIGFWGAIGGPITLDNWLFPIYVPGELRSEDPHAGQENHSSSTRVSKIEITKALDVIADFDKRLYSLLTCNCANFVAQVWRAVTGTSVDPYVGTNFDELIWVPGEIGEAADVRNKLKAQGAMAR
jgi:hypothetical protein